MMTQKNGIRYSSLLTLPGVVHGYSTRALGDARIKTNTDTIVRNLTDRALPLLHAAQVHGNAVSIVDSATTGIVPLADGLVSSTDNILLEVHVADCVPMLFFDPVARVVAAVHAGWKGTLAHIATNTVARMTESGATPSNILVSIGPHIGLCCYTVPEDRAQQFLAAFHATPPVAGKENGEWHLDIGQANRFELLDAGIVPVHIDAPIVCTSCQIDAFYSFRKDSRETFGEIIGVIGLVS